MGTALREYDEYDYVDRMMSLVGRLDATIRGLVGIMEAFAPLRRSRRIRTLYHASEEAKGEIALILNAIRLSYEESKHPNAGIRSVIDFINRENLIRLINKFPYDQFGCLENVVRSAADDIAATTRLSAQGNACTIPDSSIIRAYGNFKAAVYEAYSSKP